MIRIYFDSDVINGIKEDNLPELSLKIKHLRKKLLIPFSMGHIYDKLPSREHHKFWPDIDFISEFTDNKLLNYNQKSKFTHCEIASVREVFEAIDEGLKLEEEFSDFNNIEKWMNKEVYELLEDDSESNIIRKRIEAFKELQSQFNKEVEGRGNYKDLIQEAMDKSREIQKNPLEYKRLREEMWEGFKLPSHITDLNVEDAVKKINQEVSTNTKQNSFLEYARTQLKKDQLEDLFLHYIQCYFTLGNIGYHADKINVNKGTGLLNHFNDSMHSFFGAHCDYFVVLDKKLKFKTKILYKLFNIRTLVVSPEELIKELNIRLVNNWNIGDVLSTLDDYKPLDILVEDGNYKSLYRLKHYFLDYFTHVQIEKGTITEPMKLLFSKLYENYSNVLFFEEFDSVIKNVQKYFNLTHTDNVILEEFKLGMETNGKYSKDYFIGNSIASRLFADGNKFYFSISIFEENQIIKSE